MNRWIKTGLLSLALPVLLIVMTGTALAEGIWQADPNTGCKVWNENPQPNETFTWTGGCKDGYLDGDGVFQWFPGGKPGSRYEGPYVRGKMEGKGFRTWPNGARYEGDFVNDKAHGYGVYTTKDGRVYRGRFENDKYMGP